MNNPLILFNQRNETLGALIFAVCFSFFNTYGSALKNIGDLKNADRIIIAFNTFILSIIIAEIYLRLRNRLKKFTFFEPVANTSDAKYFFLCTVIILISWIPVFLAYYPGLFAYDVMWQIPQALGTYSTHHPLIHTVYLQFFYYFIGEKILHNHTTGIAVATIVQMIFFSMMLSYIHLFLYIIQVKKILRYTIIAFTAIMPFYSVLAISMTKDILFSGFVGIFFVSLCYWHKIPDWFNKVSSKIIYLISIIGVILFRNNGIYGIIMVVLLGLVYPIGRNKRQLLILTEVGILLSLIISAGFIHGLNATSGSFNEVLSLPYQQIACVYEQNKASLSEQDIADIIALLPAVENYDPHRSDFIKGSATGPHDFKNLISLYCRLGISFPASYLRGFVQSNLGYLYLWDVSNAETFGNTLENRQGYLLTDTKSGFDIEHTTHFAFLETIYEILFSTNKYQDVLLLDILCSPALYFWMIVLIMFYAINLRKKRVAVHFAFLLTFIMTLLAGPVVQIRYALPYIICLPPLFFCIFDANSEEA